MIQTNHFQIWLHIRINWGEAFRSSGSMVYHASSDSHSEDLALGLRTCNYWCSVHILVQILV